MQLAMEEMVARKGQDVQYERLGFDGKITGRAD